MERDHYDEGVDYKEMYLHLMRQAEKAIRTLQEAMQACEDMYITAQEPEEN